ncbi:MAG TPA: hypothetical protein VL463_28500 [Kofleriaceae bacterium]|jgi:hypothetical protein|nr:hypothetical protein [Kofleriaceae bacterium]
MGEVLATHRARTRRRFDVCAIACVIACAVLLVELPIAAGVPAIACALVIAARRRRLREIDAFAEILRTRAADVVWAYGADMGLRLPGLAPHRFTHVVIRLRTRETFLLGRTGDRDGDALLAAMERSLPNAVFGFTRARAHQYTQLGVVS